ncbi:MAG: YiiD C-terminal domain-containing protein [Marinicella sp.]|nr:YiiD C-terminal domain-containing protein [Xanthomonadales bacterium]
MTIDIKAFQAFLYAHIPLIKAMQMQLQSISADELTATAPITPNINDKQTVFGGSSAALMTICGWTLIKANLEHLGVHNDVVIYTAENKWLKAQQDDLIIQTHINPKIDWSLLANQIYNSNRIQKITVQCQVLNQEQQVCSKMLGQYVILKK